MTTENEQVKNKAGKAKKRAVTGKERSEKISLFSLITDLFKSGRDITENLSRMGLLGIFHFFNIFIVSGKKFNDDECSTKSSAIAYTTLVSLIPTLTVVLTFASIFAGVGAQKDQLFLKITRFLAEHNLEKLNVAPVFDALSGLLDNAAGVGVVGAAVTIFSATALLRTIEGSLNSIFKVKRQRSIFLKIIYYWAALTLGPIIMITGTTLATQISKTLTSPDYTTIKMLDDGLWVTGSKGTVGIRNDADGSINRISTQAIDFDNQRSFTFNPSTNAFVQDELSAIDEPSVRNLTFTDVEFIGQTGWVIAEKGFILRSADRGQHWKIEKRSYFNLRKIVMRDELHGFIIGDNGTFLETIDGGENWIIRSSSQISVDLNAIVFSGDKGIIAGDRGYIMTTSDGGANWQIVQLNEARQKKHFSDFTALSVNGSAVLLAGNDGVVLKSDDFGATWKTKRYRSYNYTSALLLSPGHYYLATTNGLLLKTTDDGSTFTTLSEGTIEISTLLRKAPHLWIAGKTGLLQYSIDEGTIWIGPKGKSTILAVSNFMTPFFFIWLLFFLMYIALPNAKVPFKAAAIGASFTAAVWVVFIYGFVVYINSFANGTFAVYGALAAFPLFLMLIYTSMQIILFGAEVAYTIANPFTYSRIRKKTHRAFGNAINAVRMIAHIFKKFESGKGSSTVEELTRVCNNNNEEALLFAEIFMRGALISLSDEKYLPATSSRNVRVADLLDMVYDFSLEVHSGERDGVAQHLIEKFNKINSNRSAILGDERLSDII